MTKANGHATLETVTVPINSLQPWPGNPRTHNLDLLRESLRLHGQYRAIVVQASTSRIVAGNGTWEAARAEGWKEIAAHFVEADDEEARRILLVDNRASDLGDYDEELLAGILQSLPDFEGTGYDEDEFRALLERIEGPPEEHTEPDAVPEAPARPVTQPGDIWLLAEHRLLCGDARQTADVVRLMGPDEAAVLWTDPPYGVEYEGKTARALRIDNDNLGGLPALLDAAFQAATKALEPGAAFYIACPAGPNADLFSAAVARVGWRKHQDLVWVKNTMVLGHSDYHYRHEPILYGWTPGPGRSGRGHHAGTRWYGDHAQTSVFEVERPSRSAEHPTMKPIALIEPMLRNSSRSGALILDLFGGSGSTLIAAHRSSRRARLMEIDPRYCDVICRRFQEFTGTLPVLEATGEAHDFTGGADGSSDREIA